MTSDDDLMLIQTMRELPRGSMAALARQAGWLDKNGDPLKSRVQRCMQRLLRDNLVRRYRGKYVLRRPSPKPTPIPDRSDYYPAEAVGAAAFEPWWRE